MTVEASIPFLMFKVMLLRLALGSKLSMVSRTMSSKSKGTRSMSRLPASILVMTSKSSSKPTCVHIFGRFQQELAVDFRVFNAAFQERQDEALDVENGGFQLVCEVAMNSLRNVSVSRKCVISSI